MRGTFRRARRNGAVLATLALAAVPVAVAQEGKAEVYNATASVKTAAGASVTVPVVISISRWTSDTEREKARGALKSGGSTAFQKTVAAMPDAGYLQVGQTKTPLRYARTLPVGGGKLVTVATDKPVFYLGAGTPEAKPKEGYDVAVAIFEIDPAGKGSVGDFAPAAKVKLDDQGAVVIEDYGAEAVRLTDITKK
jgi:hypothetical protein